MKKINNTIYDGALAFQQWQNWCVNCYGSCNVWTAWQRTFKSTRRI